MDIKHTLLVYTNNLHTLFVYTVLNTAQYYLHAPIFHIVQPDKKKIVLWSHAKRLSHYPKKVPTVRKEAHIVRV